MTHRWAEVNAALMAVLAEWNRPRALGGDGRGLARPDRGRDRPDVFAEPLLGLRRAEGLVDRSEIYVPAGTVVTPLALDFLKHRGVAVRVASGREAAAALARRRGDWGFAIESAREPGLAAALRRRWLAGPDWAEVAADAAGAARWVLDGEGRGALVVADEASVATWRANQVRGIRAATVGDVDQAARAARHLGANLLVVEPAARSIHLIGQIADRLRAAGAPAPPEDSDRDGEALP